jgi:hypothetical protein
VRYSKKSEGGKRIQEVRKEKKKSREWGWKKEYKKRSRSAL